MHLWSILQLLILLMLANGTPVVAKKFLGERFTYPLDGGVVFVDGRPLFGRSKTIRGVVLAVLVTTAGAPMIGLEWGIGVLVAPLLWLVTSHRAFSSAVWVYHQAAGQAASINSPRRCFRCLPAAIRCP